MAHFAKLGINGKILQVLTLDNKEMLDGNGVEDEGTGQYVLERRHYWPAQLWIQTSYNTIKGKYYTQESIGHKVDNTASGVKRHVLAADQSKALRGNFASIGGEWDEDNQIFWPLKPYSSWIKDTEDASWHSPIGDAPALTVEQQAQNDASTHWNRYEWNESDKSWDLKTALAV